MKIAQSKCAHQIKQIRENKFRYITSFSAFNLFLSFSFPHLENFSSILLYGIYNRNTAPFMIGSEWCFWPSNWHVMQRDFFTVKSFFVTCSSCSVLQKCAIVTLSLNFDLLIMIICEKELADIRSLMCLKIKSKEKKSAKGKKLPYRIAHH